tara:strand:- start:46833 stop:48266 length:1434 start_codon:yes stop_codon:yes gene_type:complete
LIKGCFTNKAGIEVPKASFALGIFFSITYAYCFYSFLLLLRLVYRIFEQSYFLNGPVIINESIRFEQNFYFALLSLSLYNSLWIIAIFKKPISFKFKSSRRYSIINDQVFLSFNLSHVILKVFNGILIFFVGFSSLDIFHSYKYLVFLITLVMLLENWKNIIRVFSIKVYKYIILNAIILISLAYGFAYTSVFAIEKIDSKLLANNPVIDLPEANFSTYEDPRLDVNFGYPRILKIVKKEDVVFYQLNGQFYSFNDLFKHLESELTSFGFENFGTYYVFAPSQIEMSEILKVKKLLYVLNKRKIKYVVSDLSRDKHNLRGIYTKIFFGLDIHQIFSEETGLFLSDLPPGPPEPHPGFLNLEIIMVHISSDSFKINNTIIEKTNLFDKFFEKLDSTTGVHFMYEESIPYQDYITVYSEYRRAIDSLRRKHQKVELKSKNFRFLNLNEYKEDQNRLKAMYPIRFLENDYLISDINFIKD